MSEPETPPSSSNQPAGASEGANTPANEPGEQGKTFTQADVDRIIAGRLAKFGDYDQIRQELADLREQNQTEHEKAVAEAREDGRSGALAEAANELALEVFRGAAATRNADYDVQPALDLIDPAKFVQNGKVDRAAIKAAVEQLVPEKKEEQPAPYFGGGARKSTSQTDPGPGLPRLRSAYAQPSK